MSTQEQKWNLEQLKEFYRNASYAFTSYDDPMRDYLTRRISRYGMKSVFEFGCGMGKNLVVLKGKMPKLICYGIDLNAAAVDYGHRKFGLDLHEGDEITLSKMPSEAFDMCITCSVLNHLPEDITHTIVGHLKRICIKYILILENNDGENARWFTHDYKSLGFRWMDSMINRKLRKYDVWEYEKPQ